MIDSLVKFSDFHLSAFLLNALADMQFTQPTPVQAEAIPLLLQGRHIIAQAQTGTGKTAAFVLPILEKLVINSHATQALILAPTRELANQIGEQILAFTTHQKNINISVLCGGQDYRRQLKQLRDGAQFVVGTPGRILDHITRGTLKLEKLRTIIFDEADEMLRMGFIDDVKRILTLLPSNTQIALFSATMPAPIRQIANQFLIDPISVSIKMQTATVKSIAQRYLTVSPAQKSMVLLRLLLSEEYQAVIIFVRTKISSEEVADFLQKHGCQATAIHGDLSQPLREKIISQYREGVINILVATDVAARGLDVERITHVINYDIPQDCETYVHRIGRTGRAGRDGVSILFVTVRETRMLSNIERHTRERIEKISPPNDHVIMQAREKRFLLAIKQRMQSANFVIYNEIITNLLQNNPDLSTHDIAASLALWCNNDKPWQLSLPKLSHYEDKSRAGGERARDNKYSNAKVGNYTNARGRFDQDRASSGRERTMGSRSLTRAYDGSQICYRLDVGRMHGVKPGNIVGAIANEGGIASKYITGIQINADHSTVYLPQNISREVLNGLMKSWVCGRQLKLAPFDTVAG